SQPLAESTYVNNSAGPNGVFQGSYDPNDKQVLTSTRWSSDIYFIDQDEYLDYVIQFQNTGTDTAFTVVITDTLGTDLDMGSFQQGVASHPFDVSFKPGRVVEWRFENILLPDSGTNEAASHGLVNFTIGPVQPVLPGTVFANNADIFFDFNDPVRTPDAVVVAEMSTGIEGGARVGALVFPNPAHDRLFLRPAEGVVYTEARILSVMDAKSCGRPLPARSVNWPLDHCLRGPICWTCGPDPAKANGLISSRNDFIQGQPFGDGPSIEYSSEQIMERTRPAERSQLIRLSMLLFSVLALVSFALAKVPW
ncbi:MAG TPA: hypothetical protein VKG92_01205, partial [Flavobacteriales bacterium]|nr:hypothetical protein [Flavobacteriales bacterium]